MMDVQHSPVHSELYFAKTPIAEASLGSANIAMSNQGESLLPWQ
ncbi:hypothetical protein [Methylobacillus flagellatus]|nr:hypothetical protein [Methylobacillus flagellatus]